MEDYNMFKIEKDGIKLELEYDTEEELLKYIQAIQPLMGQVKDTNTSYYPDFFELEPHFFNYLDEIKEKSNENFRHYGIIFTKLQSFFDTKSVVYIEGEELEDFKIHLKNEGLDDITINTYMTYVKDILNYCKNKKIIKQSDFKKLEKKLLDKIDMLQNNTLKETTNRNNDIFVNLDKYYNEFMEYKKNFDKISYSSLKSYKSSLLYLKYFTDKNTIFNFSFFKDVQKKLQELPSNFFKYEKYHTKSFNEVLKMKKVENFDTLNSKTINNHMSNYNKFFDYLIYEELLTDNPLNNIKSLAEEESEKVEYSQEDLDKIFSSGMEKKYFNMCKFALYAGLRIQEILSIKKDDIKDNLIHITLEDTSHKKHTRVIPIHKNILDLIEYQKKHNPSDYLFFDFSKKEEPKNVGKLVNRRLRKIINDSNKSFHSFRKNFSQEIELNTNGEEKTKKYLLGHSFKNDVTHSIYNKNKINIEKLVDCIKQITFNYGN
ncbi:tyrosine-type recombinase/integrase [Candidatus Gracilibacteria bacterium]|nr:tyrosine-type recombinase/integrase [Candidatus Gracilibacteria bacterium]